MGKSFSAHQIYFLVVDQRHCARPVVESEVICIVGDIFKSPCDLTIPCRESFKDCLVRLPVKYEYPVSANDRPGKSAAEFVAPDDLRFISGKCRGKAFSAGAAITLHTQELRPICCRCGDNPQQEFQNDQGESVVYN